MEIFWSTKLKLPNESSFRDFVQKMANRLAQGHCRYGPPDNRKQYLDRLVLEVKAYRRNGNIEHLINAANYAHLEAYAPQHPKSHYNPSVLSATRGKGLSDG